MEDEDALEDNDDDEDYNMAMLLDFSHERAAAAVPTPASLDGADDTINTFVLSVLEPDNPKRVASPDLAVDTDKTDDALPQLGPGAGGLWGSPQPLGQAGHLNPHKRRWTVNERA